MNSKPVTPRVSIQRSNRKRTMPVPRSRAITKKSFNPLVKEWNFTDPLTINKQVIKVKRKVMNDYIEYLVELIELFVWIAQLALPLLHSHFLLGGSITWLTWHYFRCFRTITMLSVLASFVRWLAPHRSTIVSTDWISATTFLAILKVRMRLHNSRLSEFEQRHL